jgi:RNA polymerase-binding transcription factor DksA
MCSVNCGRALLAGAGRPLTNQQRRDSLEIKIGKCQRYIKSFDEWCRDRDDGTGDAADLAAGAGDWQDRMLARDSAEGRLHQATRALRRMSAGKGGICELCGREIDERRLAAIPETTVCVECQRRAEFRPV